MTWIFTTPWTDERVERLKALWAEGLSCSQIAAALGGVSRNGVIGKIHRLGLHKGTSNIPRTPRVAKPKAPKEPRLKIVKPVKPERARVADGSLEPLVIPTPVEDTDIPMEQRRTLVQLTDETCRWPVGLPGADDFFFCGAPAATRNGERAPYCDGHCRRAFDRLGTSASLMRAETGRQNFTTFGNQRRALG